MEMLKSVSQQIKALEAEISEKEKQLKELVNKTIKPQSYYAAFDTNNEPVLILYIRGYDDDDELYDATYIDISGSIEIAEGGFSIDELEDCKPITKDQAASYYIDACSHIYIEQFTFGNETPC